MNARYLPLLAALLLLGTLAPTGASGPLGDPQPWKPESSWPGGEQYDPRLDQPVTLWRAGLTLREVFAGIAQQTGVSLAFSPPDDENARVPVNLFLNEQDPPSLRALMAQLSWVTECIFSCRGEEGQQTYSLMRTSLGEGAEARLEKEAAQAYAEAEAVVEAIPAKLEEIKEAMQLPRDEAIARYRGKDDPLLLTVLEKKRRAAADFATPYASKLLETLSAPHAPNATSSVALGSDLSGLDDDERALLQTAFALPDGLFEDGGALFAIWADSLGGLCVKAPCFRPGDPRQVKPGEEPTIWVLPHTRDERFAPDQQVELESLLGETRTPEEQQQRVEEVRAERSAQKDTQEKARQKATRALSARVEGLLGRTMLDHTSPFWRVQEEVAKATGMNVAADALWENVPRRASASPPGGQDLGTSVLDALESYTSACLVYPRPRESEPSRWEWGDAGSFLRFRAPERDVWRAARLPEAALAWGDGLVTPYLPKPTEAGGWPKSVDMKLQVIPEQWCRALGRLSDLQLRYGGEESYGDPKDPAVALRVAVLRAALPHGGQNPPLTRLLGQLDEEQWRALKGSGLDSASFNANQREAFTRYLEPLQFKGSAEKPAPTEAKLTLRGGDIVPPPEDNNPTFDASRYILSARLLGRTPRGMVPVAAAGGDSMPTIVEVHVDLPVPAGVTSPEGG